ncbi:MAG: CBS domain-containing protein [Nitrospinae bacterium]|nr:CBS domain-containing protein [Nitrospinota bacterium]
MLVKDIMKKDVVTISSMSTIKEALKLMRENHVKALVVEKAHENDAYGIITYTNILKEIVAEEGDIDLLNVYDVYVKPAVYVSEILDIKYVAQMMVNQSVSRLLVVDNNKLEGVISMTDIINNILSEYEQ